MNHSLAIIIPAYKGKFLVQTLASLASQTVNDFNVYVGDDNSPDGIATIVEQFKDRLSVTYKKFNDNLGATNLTAQWERCIQMCGNESWIWILPDDDMASPDCAATFLEAASEDGRREKLYRFQTVHIDEHNGLIKRTPLCPPLETNTDFIIRKLRFERNSSLAEYIFSKHQYQLVGGFTPMPFGWTSDDLLWVSLSQQFDIVTLPAGLVSLRQSGMNISNDTKKYTQYKFDAKYKFLSLLLNNKAFMQKIEKEYSVPQFKKDITNHLFYEYRSYDLGFFNQRLFKFAFKNNQLIGGGFLKNIYRLLRYQFAK